MRDERHLSQWDGFNRWVELVLPLTILGSEIIYQKRDPLNKARTSSVRDSSSQLASVVAAKSVLDQLDHVTLGKG
jgi:hypothetical protein